MFAFIKAIFKGKLFKNWDDGQDGREMKKQGHSYLLMVFASSNIDIPDQPHNCSAWECQFKT